MICPLSFAQQFGPPDVPARGSNCIEGECAWWDKYTGKCPIASLATFSVTLEKLARMLEPYLARDRYTR